MKKSLLFLLLGLMLVFGLAACGKSNDSSGSKSEEDGEIESPEVETPVEEDDEEVESEQESTIKGNRTIGLTADEFTQHFNERVLAKGLKVAGIDEYESYGVASGTQIESAELDEDMAIGIAFEDENNKELKSVLLEVEGHESRSLILDVIETMIESSNTNLKADEVQEIMTGLGLMDPTQDGANEESMYVHGELKYLVMDDEGNWLEFAVANANDDDLGID